MGFMKKIKGAAGGTDSALAQNGILGRGILTGAELSGTAVSIGVDEYRVCKLGIQVFVDNQQPYIAQCKQRIPEYMLGQLQPGVTVLAVRVDPNDPQHIAVDLQSQPPVVTLPPPTDGGAAQLLATGTAAPAVIVANEPLGLRNYEGHDMQKLTLTISPAGGTPYQVQIGNPVPAAALPVLFPGSKVTVKVEANDPNSVAVDWDASLAG